MTGPPCHPDFGPSLSDIAVFVIALSIINPGGVLHYDMGKWKADGEFHIQSNLNKPPKVLLKAVELLQSDQDFGEREMKQYIDEVVKRSTKLPALKGYRFPCSEQDQLFKANYRHASGEDCSSCNAEETEKRLYRESDEPIVHYGLIASGNAVMRSAQRRDELRDAWNVSCFEMEAAGLMDDFPCVVIGGVCDYFDDHKNKIWQPYAAVVAAAYAKNLLRVLHPEEVEITKTVVEVVKECKCI